MAPVRLVVALAFGLAAPGAALAQAALVDSVPQITVVGHARTEVVPDLVTLLAVVTERPKAEAAAAANAQAAQAMIDAIKGNGIDPKDVQTSEVSLTPVYDSLSDAEGRGTGQKLRGYQARNGVTIRLRDVGKAGALAARLIDSGANEFQGISFRASHEDEIYAKLNDLLRLISVVVIVPFHLSEFSFDNESQQAFANAPLNSWLIKIAKVIPFSGHTVILLSFFLLGYGLLNTRKVTKLLWLCFIGYFVLLFSYYEPPYPLLYWDIYSFLTVSLVLSFDFLQTPYGLTTSFC